MTIRSILGLVISLFLTGIIAAQPPALAMPTAPPALALAQQPTPPPAPPAPDEFFGNAFTMLVPGGSFLGVHAEDINRDNISRYGVREVRGAGIISIVKDSPAEKAGLRKDDVIVRFDGESVTSVRKLTRLISEVAPDQTVRLTISRGGSEQEVAVTIAKRQDHSDVMGAWQGKIAPFGDKWRVEGLDRLEGFKGLGPGQEGFTYFFGNNRRIGVTTSTLTKQLADYFGVSDGKGVLVTSVGDDSPAAKAGIRAGDVITAVDGEKVEDSGDLSRALNKKKEGDASITIIRDKAQRNITVTPRELKTPSPRVITTPQAGRVIIPRIEIPDIPEINIVTPRIELPVIPEIKVHIERGPKGKVKTVYVGPI
ncbi:MAG: PDZ domain-containing protein [Pyrinomonadaceae bacterium]